MEDIVVKIRNKRFRFEIFKQMVKLWRCNVFLLKYIVDLLKLSKKC